MHATAFIAITTFSFANIISAAHTIMFTNHCSHDLYFWTINPWNPKENNQGYTLVPSNGGSVIHDMMPNAGVSIKIRDRPYYVPAPKGILQAEYSWVPQTSSIWYDFSAIDCDQNLDSSNSWWCPFLPGGVRMYAPGADPQLCRVAECMPGADCANTYMSHGHWLYEPSLSCDQSYDVYFETCVAGASPRTLAGPDDDDYNVRPSNGTPDQPPYQPPPVQAPSRPPQHHHGEWRARPYPPP